MNRSDRELETPPAQNDSGALSGDNTFREKPTKAIIGLGVLIVLSLLLHEINRFHSSGIGAAPPQKHRAANSTHVELNVTERHLTRPDRPGGF